MDPADIATADRTSADPSPSSQAAGPRIAFSGVEKTFTIHAREGLRLPVIEGAAATVSAGECIALTGVSGAGKSTLMRILYGNYHAQSGTVGVLSAAPSAGWVDVAAAEPHEILELRRHTIGYVSQFLEVIPRVSTLDVVSEPLIAAGAGREAALEEARRLLARLRIPEKLWPLSPLTFSGGERQRVNIARGFVYRYPVLLLDEPTASLDKANRETVVAMILEAKRAGAAIVGIFHDVDARSRVCDREIDVGRFAAAAV